MVMDKKKLAVLKSLVANPAGLLLADFREATRREVSRHTVKEEQLEPLLAEGMVTSTPERSTDGRVTDLVDRFTITEKGREALSDVPVAVPA